MPKIKSHSGAKKRFKKTAAGKWLHRKSGLRHLLTGMSAKRGRFLRRSAAMSGKQGDLIRAYLPYE